MSQQLINRSLDLKQLRDEGYDLEIRSQKYLLIKSVPYVTSNREIKFGTLVSELVLAGDETAQPNTHVAYFIGEHPCNSDGLELDKIKHGTNETRFDEGLVVHHSFSAKPLPEGVYKNYHHKMETYVALISGPAQEIDPDVTARIYPVIECSEEESVFKYVDTASSRAGIDLVTRKLELGKIAVVGLGGTGTYVLDFVAKTPVQEIHLFDADKFLNHNAFRSPGAPSIEALKERQNKVDYFAELYSNMRRNIFPHSYFINASNVDQLQEMQFVFLCMDRGGDKREIVERLEQWDIPFVDVGIGVTSINDSLMGTVRTTLSTPEKRNHIWENNRISFADGNGNNDYSRNIQIADLNALNAALAVIKWKKLFGFYQDYDQEHYSAYVINGNTIINEDKE